MDNNNLFSKAKFPKTLMGMNPQLSINTPQQLVRTVPAIPDVSRIFEEENRIKAEKEQRELEYRESVLNTLQGIEKNTALLTEMTLLLQRSNEKQDEIFELIVEILEIMKSKNKEEADGKFTTVTRKITTFTDTASTVQSLIGMANTVYSALPF